MDKRKFETDICIVYYEHARVSCRDKKLESNFCENHFNRIYNEFCKFYRL